MAEQRKALVIGGGIAGMSAAIALREAGLAVDLCEKDPQWKVYGAGITITGPTLRAMGQLGILDEVLADGYTADGIDICSVEGRLLFSVDTRTDALNGLASAGGILRPVLHRILSERLLRLAPNVMLGVTAGSFEVGARATTVRLSNGQTGSYDLVVAADGINSEVRRRLFPSVPQPRYVGQLCWRLMTRRHPAILRRTFFLGGRAKVGLNPVAADKMYMFYLEASDEPLRRDDTDQHLVLRDLLEGYGGVLSDVRAELSPQSTIICRPLETVFVDGSWVHGNIVLIGDAAHATTPHLASGAGMGIEDGLALGDEVARHADIGEALSRFMQRRFSRCKLVIDSSLEISRLELERSAPEAQTAVVETALARLAEAF